MFYKMINGKIVCVKKTDDEIAFLPAVSHDVLEDKTIPWLESDREIVRLPDFSFVFADDPIAFESLKQQKKAEIAAARYDYEIAGVIINGIHITTDREDQAMITAVALSAVVDSTYTTVWKGADGYLTLSAPEILAMARIVGAHVEAAFAEEKRLVEQIDAAQTQEDLDAITWRLD